MITIILLIIINQAHAGLLVAGPEISESVYQQALSTSDLISPVDQAAAENDSENVRPEIFKIADKCIENKKCEALQDNFAGLREKILLNRKELSLLREIWKKTSGSTNCYWQSLDSNPTSCSLKKVNIENLGLRNDHGYAVIVDGKLFRNNENIYLLPKTKYHWRIVSSRNLPKQVWASMEEVENQISLNKAYVQGGCLSFKPSNEIEGNLHNLSIAFDQTCVKPMFSEVTNENPQPNWVNENKKWLVPALILFVGASYYMKDKQIEFNF